MTRGVARRDHVFPAEDTPSSIVVTAKSTDPSVIAREECQGIRPSPCPKTAGTGSTSRRSGFCRMLWPASRRRKRAPRRRSIVDADGTVKEGAATNVWIVDADGALRHASGRARHPARHHAHDADGCDRKARNQRSTSGNFPSTKCWRRARYSSRRRQAFVFRWLPSTARRLPMVIPAACRRKFVKPFSTLRKRLRFDTKFAGGRGRGYLPAFGRYQIE